MLLRGLFHLFEEGPDHCETRIGFLNKLCKFRTGGLDGRYSPPFHHDESCNGIAVIWIATILVAILSFEKQTEGGDSGDYTNNMGVPKPHALAAAICVSLMMLSLRLA